MLVVFAVRLAASKSNNFDMNQRASRVSRGLLTQHTGLPPRETGAPRRKPR
jgi:hypothetical protein